MSSALARIAWSGVFCCYMLPFPVYGQYATEPQSSVWLRALLDVRLVGGGPAPSWTDHGPGKLRYGGSSTADGFERSTRLTLAQAALQVGALLPLDVRGQIQVNIEPDIASGYHPWLVEAILRREWGNESQGWGVQGGVMNVPFSLENTGPAWSPEYTISASALDSWLWEDINLAAAEAEWWHTTQGGLRLGALLGAGYGGDQIGKLLALRGWVIGDTISGINGNLALPDRAGRTDTFNERDHRPALYSWLSLGDEERTAALKFGTIDSRGDESKSGVWHTRLNIVGLVLHVNPRIDAVAQFLDGVARVQAPPNDSAVSAYYVLLSHHYRQHRVSLRYDSFRVHDLDGGPVSTSERGHAWTLSYVIQVGLRNRIALEHIWMDSRREANGLANPTPDGWQISYRFHY